MARVQRHPRAPPGRRPRHDLHVHRRGVSSGSKSAYSIASTITAAGRNNNLDIVLLSRGGGTSTELPAYDSEAVARAICECPVPVFTALDHSTDLTVARPVRPGAAHAPSDVAERLIIEPVNRAYSLL